MSWSDVWEAGRGIYSIALVVALLLVARFAPSAISAINGLSKAMADGAGALRGATASAETLARMEAKLDQIRAAVCREPPP